MADRVLDCRSEDGITVGLLDTIITSAHVLAGHRLRSEPVREALADLAADPDVVNLLAAADAALPAAAELLLARRDLDRQADLVAETYGRTCGRRRGGSRSTFAQRSRAATRPALPVRTPTRLHLLRPPSWKRVVTVADTAIEWTEKTWNPTTGCDKI
ncbi:MAG: hypothetical protein ACREXJ_01545, partial [Gammaproteobacteria bacterium]